MRFLFLALLSLNAFAAEPVVKRLDMYRGTFTLTPRADGKFDYRAEAYNGEGLTGQNSHPEIFSPFSHYVIKGVVQCNFGKQADTVFDCATEIGRPSEESDRRLTAQLISSTGEVVKEKVIDVDFVKIEGTLVQTQSVNGPRTEAVVNSQVIDSALPIELEQRFDL